MLLAKVARAFHTVQPFSQLRTANLINRAASKGRLTEHRKLFGYTVELPLYRTSVHAMLYLQGERFVEDTLFIDQYVKQGMRVADVGANIGYLTLYFCRKVGISGHVHSFEPLPDNMREIRKHIENNKISNCSLYPVAVGADEGTIPMSPDFNSHFDITNHYGDRSVSARVTRLDNSVSENGIDTLGFIKIDVEGYEMNVLLGAEHVINAMRPILYVEMHPFSLYQQGDPTEVLSFVRRYYRNVMAYRPVTESLSGFRLLGARMAGAEALRKACAVELSVVKSRPDLRYQLLCLP